MRTGSAALLLLFAGALGAAPPDVPATITADPGQLVPVTAKVTLDKDGNPVGKITHFRNFTDADAFWAELVTPAKGERKFVYQAPPKPPKTGGVRGANGDITVTHVIGFATVGDVDAGTATTIVTTYPAPAPPPVPPAPQPGPTPAPSADAPIPAPGLHVLVVYDAKTLSALPADQQAAIFAQSVRDYLRATCPKGPDGATAEWRMWPDGVDAAGESALWQAAYKRPRASLPWVCVSNGTTGFEGPLPANADAMLALLKKYGAK